MGEPSTDPAASAGSNATEFYALLVGIDRYSPEAQIRRMQNLRGCVNDINAMERLLMRDYSVPAANIHKLPNEDATRRAIEEEFDKFLVPAAERLAASGKNGAFLFHFSGHGSRAKDHTGTEPDGFDETIVPYDSCVGDVCDIRDRELGNMLSRLEGLSNNVTVILDCCHSGSGTRQDVDGEGRAPAGFTNVRWCPPDPREQPTDHRPAGARTRVVRNLNTPASPWSGRHALLAACRDREKAYEQAISCGSETIYRGALTNAIIEELSSGSQSLTYHELGERIRIEVQSRFSDQVPQCEGRRDRLVFGGLTPARDVWLTVVGKAGNLLWIDAGLVHGVTKGTTLQVYRPGTRTMAGAGQPVAVLEVRVVGAVGSGCAAVSGQSDVALLSRALIQRSGGRGRVGVSIDPAIQSSVRPAKRIYQATQTGIDVHQLLDTDEARRLIDIVDPDSNPYLHVAASDPGLDIRDASGSVLVSIPSYRSRLQLAPTLCHLAKYHRSLAIKNEATDSDLAGAIRLDISNLDTFGTPSSTAPLELSREGQPIVEIDQNIVLQITNQSPHELYFVLLDFSHDWSVSQLYPFVDGAQEPLAPGSTFSLGLDPESPLYADPAAFPADFGETRKILKIIASREPAEYESLIQGSLDDALKPRRKLKLGPKPHPAMRPDDLWTTAELELVVIQKSDEPVQDLLGGRAVRIADCNLQAEAPPPFSGTIRILTQPQASDARSSEGTSLPPGLASCPEHFAPLQLRSARNSLSDLTVVEIEADEGSRAAVTDDTPLLLRFGDELCEPGAGAGLLACGFDGSYFFPVSQRGTDPATLEINCLPDPEPKSASGDQGARSLSRTIKLYLFKVIGWSTPELGLRTVELIPAARAQDVPNGSGETTHRVASGEIRYHRVTRDDFQPGERIALLVHGFQSDTRWMVTTLVPFLDESGIHYDHFLTFDYESFGTHIAENGESLAEALRHAGINPDDELTVDVFSHSMGCLVVRSMIETHGGAPLIDRAVLAGSPNRGTELANSRLFIEWLGTILLNSSGIAAPTLLASLALHRLVRAAVGPADLHPSSDFLRDLDKSDDSGVPYLILAGTNEMGDLGANAWQRFRGRIKDRTDRMLNHMFRGDHDLVVGVPSMTAIRDDCSGGSSPIQTAVVPCDHFSYFENRQALEALLNWLQD